VRRRYRVITARSPAELEKLLDAAIAEGFEPVGGVAVASTGASPLAPTCLYQAVWLPPPTTSFEQFRQEG